MSLKKNIRSLAISAISALVSLPLTVLASQENSASRFFTQSSSPESVSAAIASALRENPSMAPGVVVDAVSTFASYLSGKELESAVSFLFSAISTAAPDTVVKSLSAVLEKYPALTLTVVEAVLKAAPQLAREVTETAMLISPETDASKLASVVASSTGQDLPTVEGWLISPDSWVGIPTSGFPGGGGSRPQPYSN
jgi:hypothetical protein